MVKEKIGQSRTYDEDGFRQRAACICFKDNSEEEILLITSSRFTNHWVIPGGGIEPSEDPGVAASREVWEEAGVKGRIVRFLGVFQNNDRKHRTAVFELIVEEIAEDWEESRMLGRQRKWFSVDEAGVLLSHHKPLQQSYLKLFSMLKKENLLFFHLPKGASESDVIDSASSASDQEVVACKPCGTGNRSAGSSTRDEPDPVSPALSSYIPASGKTDGRLYTMVENSYYAYAPDCSNVAWSAVAGVVAVVYNDAASSKSSQDEATTSFLVSPHAETEQQIHISSDTK